MDDRKRRFRIIYDDTYDDLWRYCLRRCATATHAEDVLGETFAVAWRRFDDVPPSPDSRPYLFGIARNLIRDHHRRSGRDVQLTSRLQNAVRSRTAHGQQRADDREDLAIVVQALHDLADADQELLRLAAWEGLPHAEIAVILDCSVNAVAIRLHRARNRLLDQTNKLDADATRPISATAPTSGRTSS